jgi:hypothetical protein
VTGVPKNRVGQVVQDFIDDDVPVVTASREGAGDTYTVSEGAAVALAAKPLKGSSHKKRAFLEFEKTNLDQHK